MAKAEAKAPTNNVLPALVIPAQGLGDILTLKTNTPLKVRSLFPCSSNFDQSIFLLVTPPMMASIMQVSPRILVRTMPAPSHRLTTMPMVRKVCLWKNLQQIQYCINCFPKKFQLITVRASARRFTAKVQAGLVCHLPQPPLEQ